MTTAYAFVPSTGHLYAGHPESPARFDLLEPRLDALEGRRLRAKPATREEIALVHRPELIAAVEAACREGESIIDFAPTFVTRGSFDDALLAAGGTLECTRAVLSGAAQNAFSIIRPPGHHAEPDRSMGFCIFNNAAIAAQEVLGSGLQRVAIVDYDAHHGNGTQAAFMAEDRIAYLSTHQWGIYPGSGWFEEAPHAKKRLVNVPLPAGAGDKAYGRISDEIIEPFILGFQPAFILVSAGFDGHWTDPLTSLGLSTRGFFMLSRKLVELAQEVSGGRIVFVLEGGYDATNLANGAEAVFAALSGKKLADPQDASPHQEPEVTDRIQAIKAWHGFRT